MRKIAFIAGCLAATSAHAQSTGIPWVNGRILTAPMLQSLDQAKMNINSLGKPGFAPQLNALGQITNPVVGDVSQAKATTDGQTVAEVAKKADNAVQQANIGVKNGVAPLDAQGRIDAPVVGDVSQARATTDGKTVSQIGQMASGSMQQSEKNAPNGVAGLDASGAYAGVLSGNVRSGGSDTGTDISAANLSASMTGAQASAAITTIQAAVINPSWSSFSPQLLFGGGNAGQMLSCPTASYLTLGNIVHLWMQCSLIYKGTSTGYSTISGVPFNAVGQAPFSMDIRSTGIASDGTQVTASIQADTITIYKSINNSGSKSVATDADFENAASFTIDGWYPKEEN
ncbi:hypothetical protein AD952_05690 [Acetobacter cerevisiae]|uniref:Phage tail protein n=1 Tax=Acetobacter cerevisiae TaxID=178900 RepID=A0A149UWF4_9PROT|nr:hypothetical protein [Acetobacter cerevisiae]KXV72204.1 hypothetical protein AD952_05690 [Acetobacter cerevisiae]